ncbi:DUF418 domain-containing protein [Pseudoalteromonas luteoviolacea]|uniref:DUF418 domain-containing protein n=1 Tax=Pseudoalteromonas luteoviolacea TaxID=43657 RepID=UPI0011542904|nr:DUF418 domain-containing protein [Pseudoalteromonas luteoviolacea]TQF67609.1 DUF418 domain-containing protein [Pseudoalteromonas luteoviolacea]
MVKQYECTPHSKRIATVDSIRGFALCGIIFANLMSFFGFYSLGYQQIHALPFMDRATLFVIDWLVEGKFYTIFAILFGAGFTLLFSKHNNGGFAAYWRKRMRFLLCIGLCHMMVIWHGDILVLYSLVALTLPWFIRLPDHRLLAAILLLLTAPLVIHALATLTNDAVIWSYLKSQATHFKASFGYAGITLLEMRTSNSPIDVFIANLYSTISRPMSYFISGRPFQVLGQFVLGIYLAKKFVHCASLKRSVSQQTTLMLIISGLILNLVYATIKAKTGSPISFNQIGLIQGFCYHLGAILLALGYMSVLVKLFNYNQGRIAGWLSVLGRMSLSMYLMQTMLCVMLFYGYGLALMNTLPFYLIPIFGIGILGIQVTFGKWWLHFCRQGPAEMIWRKVL